MHTVQPFSVDEESAISQAAVSAALASVLRNKFCDAVLSKDALVTHGFQFVGRSSRRLGASISDGIGRAVIVPGQRARGWQSAGARQRSFV